MTAVDFFGPLYGVDHVPAGDEDLLFYWSIPASRDIANFIWDTDVPEVTKPWPVMEPANLRDAMVMVIGDEDVTGHLYRLQDLADYEDNIQAVYAPAVLPGLCANCGKPECQDKWCGLRGNDETEIFEGTSWAPEDET